MITDNAVPHAPASTERHGAAARRPRSGAPRRSPTPRAGTRVRDGEPGHRHHERRRRRPACPARPHHVRPHLGRRRLCPRLRLAPAARRLARQAVRGPPDLPRRPRRLHRRVPPGRRRARRRRPGGGPRRPGRGRGALHAQLAVPADARLPRAGPPGEDPRDLVRDRLHLRRPRADHRRLLVGTLGWRSIFLVNLPIGIAGLLLTRRFIAAVPARRSALGGSRPPPGPARPRARSVTRSSRGRTRAGPHPWVLGAFAVTVLAARRIRVRERSARHPGPAGLALRGQQLLRGQPGRLPLQLRLLRGAVRPRTLPPDRTRREPGGGGAADAARGPGPPVRQHALRTDRAAHRQPRRAHRLPRRSPPPGYAVLVRCSSRPACPTGRSRWSSPSPTSAAASAPRR